MAAHGFVEGKAHFQAPSKKFHCETYYKIYGDLNSATPPVLMIHGGPDAGHDYLVPFAELWSRFGIPVVFYDQIGCAKSTHLPETAGDKDFWVPSLYVAELENLVQHLGLDRSTGPGYHVLGQSWGGTVAVAFAARQPQGLRRLILAGANASNQLLKQNLWELSAKLGPELHHFVEEAVQKSDYTSPGFGAAMGAFMSTYLCRATSSIPPPLALSNQNQAADKTARSTMHGQSPWVQDGSMEHYSSIPLLPKINVPTLVYIGEFDTARYRSTIPFFDHIPRVRWVTVNGASHMAHLDSPELFEQVLELVEHFLQQKESP